ncbi:MAG TPA: shikimate kinase [Chitinophagales bacterium]|nr:shikimate kinase [Chitinophagales bacterium]
MALNRTPVFLIGFMGAGKTTFGKKLANKLGLQFVDLDGEILQNQEPGTKNQDNTHNASIKELIEQHGMEYFRALEAETLRLLDVQGKLISTGGGTPCFFDNLDYMKRRGTVVFLNVDEGVILSRLKTTDLNERPLLKGLDETGLKKFIHEKLKERLPIYQQADISFNPVSQKMEELLDLLNTP